MKRFVLSCLALAAIALPGVAMPPQQQMMPEQQMALPPLPIDESRLALVISQSDYTGGLSRIAQADAEADMIAASLTATGFVVTRERDLTRSELSDALNRFRAEVDRAGPDAVAFVYYTGHGAQHPETQDSYLLGTDAALSVASDLAVYGLDMETQRDGFAATGAKAVFLVFDACRNTGGLGGFKTTAKGLSRVEARSDMLIAFATGLGDVAQEGVYAPALAQELVRPGQTAEAAFANAQRRVANLTGRGQLPWTNNLLYNTVCFAGCTAQPGMAAAVDAGTDPGRAGLALTPPEELFAPGFPANKAGSAAQSGAPVEERQFRDCKDCPLMVALPPGKYDMGAPDNEDGASYSERPVHGVVIPRPFALGVHEVTWEEYEACVAGGGCDPVGPDNSGGDEGFGRGNRPVINVNWTDAQNYVAWLSAKTGASYRLPSETEWEYAARAGSQTPYSFGYDPAMGCVYGNVGDAAYRSAAESVARYADCNDGFGETTAPVGRFADNAFGLYDMNGNVAEWVQDCFTGRYREGHPTDASAKDDVPNCGSRVIRGGSWQSKPADFRSAARLGRSYGSRYDTVGFRIARDLTPAQAE